MSQSKNFLVVLLSVVLSVMVLGAGFSLMRSAQAQQGETSRKDKWEYCAITRVDYERDSFGRFVGFAYINYFDVSNTREETQEAKQEKTVNNYRFSAQQEAVARAMAKLGNEGWEMVNTPSQGKRQITSLIISNGVNLNPCVVTAITLQSLVCKKTS